MAVILLHGLIAGPAGPDLTTDPALPPHLLVPVGQVTAIASVASQDLSDPDTAAAATATVAEAHNHVLSAYARITTVLPVRFGAAFSAPDAVHSHFSDPGRLKDIGARLRALHGLQEFGLRLSVLDRAPVAPRPPSGSGRGFLQTRARARSSRHLLVGQRREWAAELVAATRRHAADLRELPTRDGHLFNLAILWPAAGAATLQDDVTRVQEEAAALGLSVQLTGPWPAYSFAAPHPAEDVGHHA